MKVEVAVLGSPSLKSLTVSVDVKHHERRMNDFRVQELCESRGGPPGLPVPKKPYGLCGRKAPGQKQSVDASSESIWLTWVRSVKRGEQTYSHGILPPASGQQQITSELPEFPSE